jgi:TatD DNase family protein
MQDIHTHLYWESYDVDREAVLSRAAAAGVTTMLVVGTNLAESAQAIALAQKYGVLLASAGMHPNEFRDGADVPTDWLTELTALTENPKVVAIGECGLDYSESHGLITAAEKAAQEEAFVVQLTLAKKKNLPVIVHCRSTNSATDDAYRDVLTLLEIHATEIPAVILHCYMGSQSVTENFLRVPNIYFSFTGNITYPVSKSRLGGDFDLTEVVKQVPLERLFVETDCPFLTPQGRRGERNEPALVAEVAAKVAEFQGASVAMVAAKTQENFYRVFGIDATA